MNSENITANRLKAVAPVLKAASSVIQSQSWNSLLDKLREGYNELKVWARPNEVVDDLFDLLAEMDYRPFPKVAEAWNRLTYGEKLPIASLLLEGRSSEAVVTGLMLNGPTFKELFKFIDSIGIKVYKLKARAVFLLVEPNLSLAAALSNLFTRIVHDDEDEYLYKANWTEVNPSD